MCDALVKVTEVNQININTSLKYEVLKLIQSYVPGFFGLVDQSRLVRLINLMTRKGNAVNYLEYRIRESVESEQKPDKLRPIRESDVDRVIKVRDHVGPEDFAKLFLTAQPISVIRNGHPVTSVMSEYFFDMEALRKHAFPDAGLRGGGVVAVDAIFPETLGLLNIGSLGADIAKVFWQPGAESIIPEMVDYIAAMHDSGSCHGSMKI